MSLIVVFGLSGAGKSVALQTLEEQGYYYLDNFPKELLPNLFILLNEKKAYNDVALCLNNDVSIDSLKQLSELYKGETKLLFLECRKEEIINRYKLLRRKHPLQDDKITLTDAIDQELISSVILKRYCDDIIDTTYLKEVDLRKLIAERYGRFEHRLHICFLTFGFKYGLPLDADLVLDVRFLINPYYEQRLKEKTGLDEHVTDFVMNHQLTKQYLNQLIQFLDFQFSNYLNEGRSGCVIAVGCTGGRHRSVAIAHYLATYYNQKYRTCNIDREI